MEMEPRRPVPVFPLPNVVLFPHAVVPLHIYELRYRTMVRDALAGERLIALALLQPGWEAEYHGSPAFHDLGCLARFEAVEWLPDGCYDLKLLGLSRVRLGAPVREHPYRAVRVELLPEAPYTEDDPVVRSERRALRDLYRRFVGRPERPSEGAGLADELPFVALVNAVCMVAPLEADERLGLLALDSVVERGHRACELIAHRLRPGEPSDPGEHN
jgi:Lon protease-like protein